MVVLPSSNHLFDRDDKRSRHGAGEQQLFLCYLLMRCGRCVGASCSNIFLKSADFGLDEKSMMGVVVESLGQIVVREGVINCWGSDCSPGWQPAEGFRRLAVDARHPVAPGNGTATPT